MVGRVSMPVRPFSPDTQRGEKTRILNEHLPSTAVSAPHRFTNNLRPPPPLSYRIVPCYILSRVKFDQWMRALDKNKVMPEVEEGETIFEYYVNLGTFEWEK